MASMVREAVICFKRTGIGWGTWLDCGSKGGTEKEREWRRKKSESENNENFKKMSLGGLRVCLDLQASKERIGELVYHIHI